jgi:N-acetylglucosamine kinase-like BadF-type ATPase
VVLTVSSVLLSQTALTVVSSSGSVLSTLTLGSTNPNSVGESGAAQTLQEGVKEVVKLAAPGGGGEMKNVRAIVLSISGCNNAADAARMEQWLAPLFPNAITHSTATSSSASAAAVSSTPCTLISCYNDSIAALLSGTSGQLSGLCVISGTGMIAKGFHAGKEATAGGNGALIDGGSGYSIGLNVLRAAFAASDGMGPRSVLLPAVLAFLSIEKVEGLVDWLYADRSWDRVAKLAVLAFQYAAVQQQGSPSGVPAAFPNAPALPTKPGEIDPVALGIVEAAAEYLVRSLHAVAGQLELPSATPVTVVCAGGILQNPSMFSLLTGGFKVKYPQATVVHPSMSPAEGAARWARQQWIEVGSKQQAQ